LFIVYKQVKSGLLFLFTTGVVGILLLIPYIPTMIASLQFVSSVTADALSETQYRWSLGTYLWQNLGVLPIVASIGCISVRKNKRFFLPMVVIFASLCLFAGYHHRGFDQKFLSLFIIPINILAAFGLHWIWEKTSVGIKMTALLVFMILTVSGFVDLLVVKNEFAFPIINNESISVVSWIQSHTPKTAVFVSYADMIDPVVLAGRKNYFGFFGNMGWYDRSNIVRQIYKGNSRLACRLGISYIVVPKWNKNDFPYIVDTVYFLEHNMLVYEDNRYMIFDMRKSCDTITP
jgi:hypothetical protein